MKFLSAIVLGLAFTTGAYACSCEEQTAAEIIKNSEYLFLAVPAQDSVRTGRSGEFGQQEMESEMIVIKNFKNMGDKVTNVITDEDLGANCGVNFKKDEAIYLIQGYKDGSNIHTDSCSILNLDYPETIQILREITQLSEQKK